MRLKSRLDMVRLSIRDVVSTTYSRYSCLIIVVCQLIALLCVGAIIYIVAIVFVPTHNVKFSGFSRNAALCSTVSSKLISGCVNQNLPASLSNINSQNFQSLAWSSCGESCPIPPKGVNDTEPPIIKDCRQIRVNVRHFGTDISLEGCRDYKIINCDGIDENKVDHVNEDRINSGLYRCEILKNKSNYNGTNIVSEELSCNEISKYFKCDFTNNGESIDCSSGMISCLNSEPGLYQCNSGMCTKLSEPFNCQRLCEGIETSGKNVLIHHRDKIHIANCKKALSRYSRREFWPLKFRNLNMPTVAPTLLLNCQDLRIRKNLDKYGNHSDSSLIFGDCVNGTVLERISLPEKISLEELLSIWAKEMTNDDNLLDPIEDKHAPRTTNLSIHWNLRLYFIYDLCGNIPSDDDCWSFYRKYGIPVNHHLAQSTFPCYYSNKFRDFAYAVVEPTRSRTKNEIWKDAVIPTVIAVASCFIVLVFAVSVTIIVFLHPLINENFSSNATTESYDDISHTAGKRPSIIFTIASPATPTKTAVHNFSLSPGNSYIRRSSHPNLNGNATHNASEEGRKRVSWVEPGPVEQRWAY